MIFFSLWGQKEVAVAVHNYMRNEYFAAAFVFILRVV